MRQTSPRELLRQYLPLMQSWKSVKQIGEPARLQKLPKSREFPVKMRKKLSQQFKTKNPFRLKHYYGTRMAARFLLPIW